MIISGQPKERPFLEHGNIPRVFDDTRRMLDGQTGEQENLDDYNLP